MSIVGAAAGAGAASGIATETETKAAGTLLNATNIFLKMEKNAEDDSKQLV